MIQIEPINLFVWLAVSLFLGLAGGVMATVFSLYRERKRRKIEIPLGLQLRKVFNEEVFKK